MISVVYSENGEFLGMSDQIKTWIKRNSLLFMVLIWFLFAGFISQTSLIDTLRVIWIEFAAILLPGIFVLDLIDYKDEDYNRRIFIGYAVGSAICIFLYLFMAYLSIQRFSGIIANVIAVACFVYYMYQLNTKVPKARYDEKSTNALIVILFIAIFARYCLYQLPNLSAHITGFFSPDLDSLWWLKNSVAVSKGYPVHQLGLDGHYFYYHLFSNNLQAYLHFATGVELFDLTYSFSYIWEMLLVVGSVYTLASSLIRQRKLIFLCLAVTLFTTGFEALTATTYTHHIYINTFGFPEGYAYSVFALFMFLEFYKKPKYGSGAISILLFAAALGCKAPSGCIILPMIGMGCIFMLFNKTKRLFGLAQGVLYLTVFITLFIFILNPPGLGFSDVSATQGGTAFSLDATIYGGYFLSELNRFLTGYLSPVVSKTAMFVIFTFMIGFVHVIFNCMAAVKIIKNRMRVSYQEFAVLFSGIIGVTLYLCISMIGRSQMYFYLSAVPFLTIFPFAIFDKDYVAFERIRLRECFCAIIIALGLMPTLRYDFGRVISSTQSFQRQYSTKVFKNAVVRFTGIGEPSVVGKTGNDGANTLTSAELEGLRWVRDNTERNTITINNKSLLFKTSFVTECFSERSNYYTGWVLHSEMLPDEQNEVIQSRFDNVKKYFVGDDVSEKTLRESNVKYVVIYKRYTNYASPAFYDEIVFNNSEIQVLKL